MGMVLVVYRVRERHELRMGRGPQLRPRVRQQQDYRLLRVAGARRTIGHLRL
ncbi:hypothetical protein THIOM_001675 [Candidatus Thiomargarita nelsonii]|uniref:Uncharacterized protein n=1 Tax=Candidatus Thiomargarita nelsonii TaxID=1003181 RepID=A0A176S3M1_9GAMM|nr:hypothetical protein THIOM_001675 [Candidatus Thiomargarita nelsonii]